MLLDLRTIAVLLGVLAWPAFSSASLVAYYPAEGNANDSSGNGHNGSLVNGAGFGTGKVGQAFSLNGSTQDVSAPDSAAWACGSNPFSVSAWVNFNSIRTGALGNLPNVFVGQDEGGGTTNKWVFFYDGNGNLAFHVNGPSSVFLTAPTTFTPSTGAWHLYTVTRTSSTYTFYADSTSLGTASSAVSIPDASALLTIGEVESTGFVDGRIDETRIYNHALTPAEIAVLAVPEPGSALAALLIPAVPLFRRARRTNRRC